MPWSGAGIIHPLFPHSSGHTRAATHERPHTAEHCEEVEVDVRGTKDNPSCFATISASSSINLNKDTIVLSSRIRKNQSPQQRTICVRIIFSTYPILRQTNTCEDGSSQRRQHLRHTINMSISSQTPTISGIIFPAAGASYHASPPAPPPAP